MTAMITPIVPHMLLVPIGLHNMSPRRRNSHSNTLAVSPVIYFNLLSDVYIYARIYRVYTVNFPDITTLEFTESNLHDLANMKVTGSSASFSGSPQSDQFSLPRKDLGDRPSRQESPRTPLAAAKLVDEATRDETIKGLGVLLQQIIGEATDFAVLKIQKSQADKEFERKDAEYKKAQQFHEKFPATEETQRKGREKAEKAQKALNEKLQRKDVVLKEFILQGTYRFLPGLLSSGGSDADKSQNDARMKELEETVNNLQNKLLDQQSFTEELKRGLDEEKKARERDKKAFDNIKDGYTSLSSDISALKPQVTEALQTKATTNADILALRKEIEEASQKIPDVPKDVKQKMTQVDELTSRVDSLNTIKDDLKKLMEECAKTSKALLEHSKSSLENSSRVSNLEATIHGPNRNAGLAKEVIQLVKEQKAIRGDLKKSVKEIDTSISSLGAKVNAIEALPNPKLLENRLNDAESKLSAVDSLRTKVNALEELTAGQSQLEEKLRILEAQLNTQGPGLVSALASRVDKLENINRGHTGPNDHEVLAAVQSRVEQIEIKMADIFSLEERVVTSQMLDDIRKEFRQSMDASTKCVVTLQDKEKRTAEILGSLDIPSLKNMSTAAARPRPLSETTDFEARVMTSVQAKLEQLEGQIKAVRTTEWIEHMDKKLLPLGHRMLKIEQTLTEKRPSAIEANAPLPAIDQDKVKTELLEILHQSQDAMLDAITAPVESLQKDMKAVKARCDTLEKNVSDVEANYASISDLPASFQEFKKSQSAFNSGVIQQQEELKNANTFVASHVVEKIRNEPDFLQIDQRVFNSVVQHLKAVVDPMRKELNDRVDSSEFVASNISKRLDNISTKDMGLFILSQLESQYPDLRNFQDTLAQQTVFINTTKAKIDNLVLDINATKSQIKSLESRGSTPSETKAFASIRAEVDDIVKKLSKIQTTANTAKESVVDLKAKHDRYQSDIASEFARSHVDIEDLKKEIKEQKAKQPALPITNPPQSRAASRNSATSPVRAISNGFGPTKSSGVQQRQASAEKSQHKRKNLNGSVSSNGSKGQNGTPAKKRRRRYSTDNIISDNSSDADFEPKQPKLSADDEED